MKRYDKDKKIEIINILKNNSLTKSQIARLTGISAVTLNDWVKKNDAGELNVNNHLKINPDDLRNYLKKANDEGSAPSKRAIARHFDVTWPCVNDALERINAQLYWKFDEES